MGWLFFPSNILLPVFNLAKVRSGQNGLLAGAPWYSGVCLPCHRPARARHGAGKIQEATGPDLARGLGLSAGPPPIAAGWAVLLWPPPRPEARGQTPRDWPGTTGGEAQATGSQRGSSSFHAWESTVHAHRRTHAHTPGPRPCPTPPTCPCPCPVNFSPSALPALPS